MVAWVAFNLAVGAGFLAFYLVTVHSQSANCLEADQKFWKDQFPPLAEFWRLPGWLLQSHAGDMLAHPVGGRNYGSSLTLIGCVAALVVLARRKQAALVILLLAPFALNFLAAALHRYPYGGHVRIAMHLAPIVCLLVSLGLSLLVRRCVERRPSLRPLPVALVGLLLLPIVSMARDVGHPYRSASDLEIREFSRWFWTAAAEDAELVCMKTDLGIDFPLGGNRDDDSALYLCNQRIYSPRHARGEGPHLDQVCPARPLRCVRFNSTRSPQDPQAWERWLRQMQIRYGHASRQCYEFPIRTREGRVVYVQQVETLDFRPRGNLVGLAATPRRPAESPERVVR